MVQGSDRGKEATDVVVVTGEGGGSTEGPELRPRAEGPLDEPLLDAVAAARLLAVKPSWMYDAVRSGRLPHIRLGRHIRFLRSDLEEWVLTRQIGGRADRRAGG